MSIFDGVGQSSIYGMKTVITRSGAVGALPLCFDTSDHRDGGPFHGTDNATDWGNNADQWAGSPEMDRLCRWLAANYGPYSLEIIHVYQDGSTEEWKFGQKKPAGWYGQATLDEHRGHVHWAITNLGILAAGDPPQITHPEDEMKFPHTVDCRPQMKAVNSHDPIVRRLQGLLRSAGGQLDVANTDPKLLFANVEAFQRNMGIQVDGVVGDETWAAFFRPTGLHAAGKVL